MRARLRSPALRSEGDGDLPADAAPADLACYVVTVIRGMAVQAAGASREELRRVMETCEPGRVDTGGTAPLFDQQPVCSGATCQTDKPKTIDEYLAALSDDKRAALEKLRKTIRAVAPEAEECISYQLPAF